MSEITWLHFSDLHLCSPKSGWEYDRILEELKKDLQQLQQTAKLRPDLIFFTGDAAFGHLGESGGNSITEQFETAGLLFDEIRESFSPIVPKENFFIVPGNHDVNRKKTVDGLINSGLEKRLSNSNDYEQAKKDLSQIIRNKDELWNGFMERLADYRNFLNDQGYTHLLQDPDRLCYTAERDIGGIKVGIAGFNSAWSCHAGDSKGNIRMASHWQIEKSFKPLKKSNLKIALLHHPTDWLHPSEYSGFQKKLKTDFDFLLHGHDHDNWVSKQGRLNVISSGVAYNHSNKESGYNVVRLNWIENSADVWLRECTKDTWMHCSIPNIAPDGIWEIEQCCKKWKTSNSQITDSDNIDNKSPHNKLEERGVYGREREIQEVIKVLEKKKILTLYGLSGIGKSVLIKEVVEQLRSQYDYHSMVIIKKTTTMEELFQSMARVLGCRKEEPKAPIKLIGKIDFSELKEYAENSNPTIVHLENAHFLFGYHGFYDSDISELLQAIAEFNPKIRIILESRTTPPSGSIPGKLHKAMRIKGINCSGMTQYFQRPFKDRPEVGWTLTEEEAQQIHQLLGAKQDGFAHPLAMSLLAIVADGNNESPTEVWQRHQELLVKQLETKLFAEIYEEILTPQESRMLRICSLYRGKIPNGHTGKLEKRTNSKTAFSTLFSRCLLTPDENEEWFQLHAIIQDLTTRKIDQTSDDFYKDHETIADCWLEQLKQSGSHRSRPKIRASNEAFFHLHSGKCYRKYRELSVDLLQKGVVVLLEQDSRRLQQERKIHENRKVLELIVQIDSENHKSFRFLGEIIQKLEGKGSEKALECFEKAYRLNPAYPQYLANLGRCLLARQTPERFVKIVDQLDDKVRMKIVDDHVLTVYIDSLVAMGEEIEASSLRQEQIKNTSRNPTFYNDEAKWLAKKGRYEEALAIITKAEQAGCANEYILSVKTGILEETGDESKASNLRQLQIEKGAKHPAFYNDEAKWLAKKGRYEEALAIITKAEQAGCANEYILSVKTGILEETDDESKASNLRQLQIEKGAKNPAFYNDEAKWLAKKGRYEEALAIIAKAEQAGCADKYTLSIKTGILEETGNESKASNLRREQIEKGTKNPVFYNDEAKWLAKKGRYEEALQVIEMAEKVGCSNEYILIVKTLILEKNGREEEASKIRRRQIENNLTDPVFYNEETKWLAKRGQTEEALHLIEEAEKMGSTNDFTLSIKSGILEQIGNESEASDIRRMQINQGSKNPVFYNNEVKWLMKNGQYEEALALLEKLERLGKADVYTRSIKNRLLRHIKL